MIKEHHVDTLKPGSVFRGWLLECLGDRIRNKNCHVEVYKIAPASHTVCRYEFVGEGYSVVAKFYAEPTGWKTHYNPVHSMEREFRTLKKVAAIIDVPKPVGIKREFNCVLVTEFVKGRPLFQYMKSEKGLYDRLTSVAHLLRHLHDHTASDYRKQEEFAYFHKILDQLRLSRSAREQYNRLLGDWWYSTVLDRHHGSMIHNDANPMNYVFDGDRVYALDFESSRKHANPVHDLGIIAAELKHYFAMHKGDDRKAEPYIGHFMWQYSRGEDDFRRITRIVPFFMSLGLLRMARLWLDHNDNSYIFREAYACLKAKP